MELPAELKRLIEKYKAQYHIAGTDEEILQRVIPRLEDEDIIKIYDELCEEENNNRIFRNGQRPNFEKYREGILNYLDDSVVKAELIKREQRQSSKPDLQQRNYTYISEFANNLDNKPDKLKIIKNFYRKIEQLEEERELLNIKEAINSIELSIHIYECILHICEKLKMELILYRGPKYNKKYKLINYVNIKKIKRKKQASTQTQMKLQILSLNQTIKHINDLKKQLEKLKEQERLEDGER